MENIFAPRVPGDKRGKQCPPHGPLLAEAVEEGVYVTRCLRCGMTGPPQEDGVEAKRAFEESSAG
jgi:hypothetical protein